MRFFCWPGASQKTLEEVKKTVRMTKAGHGRCNEWKNTSLAKSDE